MTIARKIVRKLRQICFEADLADLLFTTPKATWLYVNRGERMDATVQAPIIFNPLRQRFHRARYEFAYAYCAGKHCLDIACGTGYGVRMLRTEGKARSVLGCDIDPNAVAYAQEFHTTEGTSFKQASLPEVRLNDTFELITSFETVEHVEDIQLTLVTLKRHLAPNGHLIVSIPNEWDIADAPYHKHKLGLADMQRYFALAELSVIATHNQNSASKTKYNRQPEGIVRTTDANAKHAECYLFVLKAQS